MTRQCLDDKKKQYLKQQMFSVDCKSESKLNMKQLLLHCSFQFFISLFWQSCLQTKPWQATLITQSTT